MRTIKFRGKRVNGDEWVYGLVTKRWIGPSFDRMAVFIQSIEGVFITESEVIPESVGQFTGLLDKNGTEIYEGDLLKNGKPDWADIIPVIFKDACFTYEGSCQSLFIQSIMCGGQLEVCGNIHDNKELF